MSLFSELKRRNVFRVGIAYVLIAVLDWGVAGSAWGTVFAQGSALLAVAAFRLAADTPLHLRRMPRRGFVRRWPEVLALGAPLALLILAIERQADEAMKDSLGRLVFMLTMILILISAAFAKPAPGSTGLWAAIFSVKWYVTAFLLIVLALMALWGAVMMRWRGKFEYPILGRALRREMRRVDDELRNPSSE